MSLGSWGPPAACSVLILLHLQKSLPHRFSPDSSSPVTWASVGPNFYKGGGLAHGGRWGDSPRGMHVVGTPDAEVRCGWHAALRVPVREAADGAGLQGAAPPSCFGTAPRAGEALVVAANQRRPCRSLPARAAPSLRSLTVASGHPSRGQGSLPRTPPEVDGCPYPLPFMPYGSVRRSPCSVKPLPSTTVSVFRKTNIYLSGYPLGVLQGIMKGNEKNREADKNPPLRIS